MTQKIKQQKGINRTIPNNATRPTRQQQMIPVKARYGGIVFYPSVTYDLDQSCIAQPHQADPNSDQAPPQVSFLILCHQ